MTWEPTGLNLAGELAEAVAGSGNPRRCSVCIELARLEGAERVSLQTALNSKLGAKRLSTILRKHGIPVGVPSIHTHRLEGHTP